jgi:hypothetical protein
MMAENFDPVSEAQKLETTVKLFIDHSGYQRVLQIEDSQTASAAQNQLVDQLSELWKNPEHLAAVGKELEKISSDLWSSLPNVAISATEGKVTQLEFTASNWDLPGSRHGFRARTFDGKLNTYGW